MATWIKCTNMKHEVFINLDNAVTVTRNENDVAERGNRDQVYILVNEQPEETVALILDDLGMFHGASYMKLRMYFPVMLGEYWVYVLAGIISISTLILLYSHN
jgi:hypothetical protein